MKWKIEYRENDCVWVTYAIAESREQLEQIFRGSYPSRKLFIAIHSPRWHLTIERRRPLMFSELYRQRARAWVFGPILVSFRRPPN